MTIDPPCNKASPGRHFARLELACHRHSGPQRPSLACGLVLSALGLHGWRQERMLVARQDGILTDPVRQVTMAQGMMRGVVDALARLRS